MTNKYSTRDVGMAQNAQYKLHAEKDEHLGQI